MWLKGGDDSRGTTEYVIRLCLALSYRRLVLSLARKMELYKAIGVYITLSGAAMIKNVEFR